MIRETLNRWNWDHHGVDCDDDPTSENFTTHEMFIVWIGYWFTKIVGCRAIRSYGDR
jgi:hypothetical protein